MDEKLNHHIIFYGSLFVPPLPPWDTRHAAALILQGDICNRGVGPFLVSNFCHLQLTVDPVPRKINVPSFLKFYLFPIFLLNTKIRRCIHLLTHGHGSTTIYDLSGRRHRVFEEADRSPGANHHEGHETCNGDKGKADPVHQPLHLAI